jgi:Flp pilus assembly pilin Flp
VLEAFVAEGINTVLVPEDDGTSTRVTMEGLDETRSTVDYEALATLVSADVLASVSATVLDKDKFAAAVEMGIIPAKVAEMVTTVKPVKPSVRVTFKAKK